MVRQMDEWMVDGWPAGQMDGWTDRLVGEWVDEWTDGWMMDGQIGRKAGKVQEREQKRNISLKHTNLVAALL